MGNITPSKRRRDGRNAFQPCANPEEACPYKKGSWNYQHYYPDFLEGWKEAEKEFDKDWEEFKKEEVVEPCCDYCLKLKEEIEKLKAELQDLRQEFETHVGYYNPDEV